MTVQRIKELEAKVARLEQDNKEQERALTNRAFDIEALKDEIDSLASKVAATDCGSAQLNRTAFTCRWHETCLTCERDELRAELEKLREQGRQDAA